MIALHFTYLMRSMRRLLGAGLLLCAAGCTDAGFTLANLPGQFSSLKRQHDLPYGREPWQKMDLYVPAHGQNEKLDTLVFFYGGAWQSGRKEDYRFVAETFGKRGFITAIPDYRKYPEVKFPAFQEDGAAALAWVYDHVEAWGGDKARIFVAGHSAGAHLAALLAVDKKYLAAHGKTPRQVIRKFAGLSGPYAFTPGEPDYIAIFGPPERYSLMQAPNFVNGDEPPMLLLHGGADDVVEQANSERLAAALRSKRESVKLVTYPGVGHLGTVTALTWLNPPGIPVADEMITFFRAP